MKKARDAVATSLLGGVVWIVPDEPLSMSPAQVETFAALYPYNCRPVQPLGERDPYRG